MTYTFTKSDALSSVILGEIIAVFLILISKNLERSIPVLDILIRSKWLIFILVPALIAAAVYGTFLLGRSRSIFFQLGKFITVGVSNTAIDFGILNLLIFLTDVEKGYLYSVFKAVSFTVAVINSYLWNKFWTFHDTETKGAGKEFFQFMAISGIGFAINVAIASLIVNVIDPVAGIGPRLWANVGAFLAVAVSVLWNFAGYKFVVFKK